MVGNIRHQLNVGGVVAILDNTGYADGAGSICWPDGEPAADVKDATIEAASDFLGFDIELGEESVIANREPYPTCPVDACFLDYATV